MNTIEETRLIRLNILKEEYGSIAALSKKTGISYSQLNQWFNQSPDSKKGKPRAIHSTSARQLENTCNKHRGWMDQPVVGNNDKKILAIVDILEQLDENELE